MLLIRHHNQPQTFLSPSSTRTPALRCSSRRLRHTKVCELGAQVASTSHRTANTCQLCVLANLQVHAAMFRVAANEAPPQQPALTHCRCYSEFDYNRVYLSKHLSKFVARSTIQLLVSVHDAAWDPDAYLRDLVAQAHSVPDSPADAGGSVLGPYSATTSEEWPNCWELECGYDLLSFSSYRVVLQEKVGACICVCGRAARRCRAAATRRVQPE